MKTVVVVALLSVAAPASLAGQLYHHQSAAARVRVADVLLKGGNYAEAQALYAEAARASAGDTRIRARAFFGLALASQQGAAVDSAASTPLDSLLAAYRAARTLDSARYYGPASNNAGLVLRERGRHREALRYFLDAASTPHPARAYFYLNAGHEYQTLGLTDSASGMYRRALQVDSGYTEARQALLVLYAARPSSDSLLALARRWGADPAAAAAVNDAILEVLARPAAPGEAESDALLVALVRNFATTGLGVSQFADAYAPRLAEIEGRQPRLAGPIRTLREAYGRRRPGDLYRAPTDVSWWHQGRSSEGRRKAWSSMLRVIGDWYNQNDSADLAASFYEAAVGYPNTNFAAGWIDLDALLPLGVIYVSRLDTAGHDPGAVERLNQLTDQLFMGKGAAYQSGDLRRIRSFHITLGKMYADRGLWGDMYNARSAVFQLERMQMMTRRMREEGDTTAFDPPQLLEALARGYYTTSRQFEGRRTAKAAIAAYERLGRQQEAARVAQWLDTLDAGR
jgi:Tfp pilus assembly protein PilF